MSSSTQIETTPFDNAVNAIINGDVDTLRTLLNPQPELVHQRSSSEHRASLIHYVSANGVEDDKQKTPTNVVEIARTLFEAGANPHEVFDAYGGSTALVALISSAHPAQAGKLYDLVRLFCQYGNPNGLNDDGMPLATAIDFHRPDAIQALIDSGARVDNIVFAAAIGNLELVKALFNTDLPPYTNSFGVVTQSQAEILEKALVASALQGHQEIVAYLVENGVDINGRASTVEGTALHEAISGNHIDIIEYLLTHRADISLQDKLGFTPLHRAAWNGQLEIVRLLLENDAPLEIVNNYGGTVLDSTVYGYANTQYPSPNQIEILQALIDAGADVSKVSPFPTGNVRLDAFLQSYILGE